MVRFHGCGSTSTVSTIRCAETVDAAIRARTKSLVNLPLFFFRYLPS
jgi:hypothetical protein